jgi:putative transposase
MQVNNELSIAKQMQLIKGESSFWVNRNGVVQVHFEWADEYFAVSISGDKLDNVRVYIANQQVHHKRITFEQEYRSFLKHFSFVQG